MAKPARPDRAPRHPGARPPRSPTFSYREEFQKLDAETLKLDIFHVLTTSHDWCPYDFRPLRRPEDSNELARRQHLPASTKAAAVQGRQLAVRAA